MVYGVYSNSDLVHWSPAKIFQDEIKVRELAQSSHKDVKLNYHTLTDHRFVRTNPLLSSGRCLSRQWQDQS